MISDEVGAAAFGQLTQRAAANGCVEADHRASRQASLEQSRRRSLAEALASMPNVGRDEDFERHQKAG